MLFDIASAEKHIVIDKLPDGAKTMPPGLKWVAASFWAEHCMECGAPYCYETCDKFLRGPDFRCRRFIDGIVGVRLRGDGVAYSVNFRPWGKLELEFLGGMIAPKVAIRLMKLFSIAAPVVSWLNKILDAFHIKGQRNFITAWQHHCQVTPVRHLASSNQPNGWYIQAYTEEATELLVEIEDETGIIYHDIMKFSTGWTDKMIDVPRIQGRTLFRLGSIDGVKKPVIFEHNIVGAWEQKPRHAKYVKCVAWDLDNTIWSGILAEDGSGAVRLKKSALEVIRQLDAKGIVNSIVSKNDFDMAWAELEKLGIAEYFVFPRVNWAPKSENIKDIAKAMNIGLDAIAFVDDSANERGEVQHACPVVRVYTDGDIGKLMAEDCFQPPISSESKNRRKSYQDEMKRQQLAANYAGPQNEFLRSCEIVLECKRLTEGSEHQRRCWELVNRTNQLTLAARRYTEEQFVGLIKGSSCYSIACHDKFGDYGIVGFIALGINGTIATVNEFVMSCRVAKKKCEQSVLLAWVRKLASLGVNQLVAELVKTERNNALFEAFGALPFEIEELDEHRFRYSIHFDRFTEDERSRIYQNDVMISD